MSLGISAADDGMNGTVTAPSMNRARISAQASRL
jgi:hypothetical protein